MAFKSVDSRPNCIMGNGKCPLECPLYQDSTAISKKLGEEFNPFMSRLAVVFGDVFNQDANVIDVAAVMGSCLVEIQKR